METRRIKIIIAVIAILSMVNLWIYLKEVDKTERLTSELQNLQTIIDELERRGTEQKLADLKHHISKQAETDRLLSQAVSELALIQSKHNLLQNRPQRTLSDGHLEDIRLRLEKLKQLPNSNDNDNKIG